MESKVKKVVAYITRKRNGKMQLLVFTHPNSPEAGLQVPAGTIKQGEEPEVAVLREAIEETGLENLQVVRALGVFDYFNSSTGQINERHVFHLLAPDDTAESWDWLETGGGALPDHEGHLFAFYWLDLDVTFELAGNQGDYLHVLDAEA